MDFVVFVPPEIARTIPRPTPSRGVEAFRVPGEEMRASRLLPFGAMVVLAATAERAWAGDDLYGTSSYAYQQQGAGEETLWNFQDALNVTYNTRLNPEWAATASGHVRRLVDSELVYPVVQPYFSGVLSHEIVTLSGDTSFLEDRNYQEATAELDTSYSNVSLGLHAPDLPVVTANYNVSTAQDDLEPRAVDIENTNRSVGVFHTLWDEVQLNYLHSESESVTRLSGTQDLVLFQDPYAVAADPSGLVYVLDRALGRVLKFSPGGALLLSWGSTGGGAGQFITPGGIAVDAGGNVYVTDSGSARVQKFDANGAFLRQWGVPGNLDGQFQAPAGIATDATGVYVVDGGNNRVQKFDADGAFLLKWGSVGFGNGQFVNPVGIASDGTNVYVADTGNHRIERFDVSGGYLSQWGAFGAANGFFSSPLGVAADGAGVVYVADTGNDRIQRFSSTGAFLLAWGETGAGPGQFRGPSAVAADRAANVYVTDRDNLRVQRFLPNGAFVAAWENGQVPQPGTFVRTSLVDSFGGSISHSFRNIITAGASFGLDRSVSGDNQSEGEAETLHAFLSPTVTLRLLRDADLAYALATDSIVSRSTGTETTRESVSQGWTLSARPISDVTAVASWHTSTITQTETPEVSSWGPAASLNLRPFRFMTLNAGWSESWNEVSGHEPIHASLYSASSNLVVFHGNTLALAYAHGASEDPETRSESTSDTVSGDAFLLPWRPFSITSRTGFGRTVAMAPGSVSIATQWSQAVSTTWNPATGFAFTNGFTYDLAIPEPGEPSARWTVTSSANYSWDAHSVSVMYSLTREEVDTHLLRASGRFGLWKTGVLGLSMQTTIAGPGAGDYAFMADFSISF